MAAWDDTQQTEEIESAAQPYGNPGDPVGRWTSVEEPPAVPDAIRLIPDFIGWAGLGLALSILVLVAVFALLDAAWQSAPRLPRAPEQPPTGTSTQREKDSSQTAPDIRQTK
jgi:hypothetical protein